MRTAKTDQTGRLTRLIWGFAGRTGHFVGFVMRTFICNLGESNERTKFGVFEKFFVFFFFIYI